MNREKDRNLVLNIIVATIVGVSTFLIMLWFQNAFDASPSIPS